ncbi:MAG: hypothetical protein AAF561_16500 [Planctomycetota bacterium]
MTTSTTKPTAIVIRDSRRESDVLLAAVKTGHEVIEVDVPDDVETLVAATAALAKLVVAAQQSGARVAFLPLRLAASEVAQGLEWQQTAEELLRHGHGLDELRIEMPLLEHDDRRLDDLANQLGMPNRAAA